MLSQMSQFKNSGTIDYLDVFTWNQGFVLGGNAMNFWAQDLNWNSTEWQWMGNGYMRYVYGTSDIILGTQDFWDFAPHDDQSFWWNLTNEYGPEATAELYAAVVDHQGHPFSLYDGTATVHDYWFCAQQWRQE